MGNLHAKYPEVFDSAWFQHDSVEDFMNAQVDSVTNEEIRRHHFLCFSKTKIRQSWMIRELMNHFVSHFDAQLIVSGNKNIFSGFAQVSSYELDGLRKLMHYLGNNHSAFGVLLVLEFPFP